MSGKLRENRLLALFGVSLALTGLVLAGYGFGSLESLEYSTVDERFEIRGSEPPADFDDFAMVKVDDDTFSELNLQWPFPRGAHARVIDRLSAEGAKVIAYDVQFTEPSASPRQDQQLIDAVDRAENVVLATSETDRKGRTRVFGGDSVVKALGATVGNSLMPEDTGGVIRRLDRERGGIPSFSVATAAAAGVPVDAGDFNGDGTAWIDYAGPPGTIPSTSFSRVLKGQFPEGTFRDKIVVVGAFAPTLQDLHRTSTSGNGEMPGPEIQANATLTILEGFPLDATPGAVNVILILLLGMFTATASIFMKPRGVMILVALTGVAYALATYGLFELGLIIPFVYPMLALVLTGIAAIGVNYVAESYEKARVRQVFSRFVADSVVDEVLAESDGGVKLGGKRIEATVMFSDLRGFTSFAEKLEPELVIEVLNRYLGEMSDAILDHQGTLVSFMGDGIMAVFGAPIENDRHAKQALDAARDMLERLDRFNEWSEGEGLGSGFRMGIGLNTGPVMSGNVGSERRLEYTALGDTTNTAARLEGATKGTAHQLYVAESTLQALGQIPADLEFVEEMAIRGRVEGVKVWGMDSPAGTA